MPSDPFTEVRLCVWCGTERVAGRPCPENCAERNLGPFRTKTHPRGGGWIAVEDSENRPKIVHEGGGRLSDFKKYCTTAFPGAALVFWHMSHAYFEHPEAYAAWRLIQLAHEPVFASTPDAEVAETAPPVASLLLDDKTGRSTVGTTIPFADFVDAHPGIYAYVWNVGADKYSKPVSPRKLMKRNGLLHREPIFLETRPDGTKLLHWQGHPVAFLRYWAEDDEPPIPKGTYEVGKKKPKKDTQPRGWKDAEQAF